VGLVRETRAAIDRVGFVGFVGIEKMKKKKKVNSTVKTKTSERAECRKIGKATLRRGLNTERPSKRRGRCLVARPSVANS
jgi:hypothetical protein